MLGSYLPFNDGFGIVGYGYECPKCGYTTQFTNCEEGCEKCNFSEPFVDPDDWYDDEMAKPKEQRQWNIK